jgi:hypothetical protein
MIKSQLPCQLSYAPWCGLKRRKTRRSQRNTATERFRRRKLNSRSRWHLSPREPPRADISSASDLPRDRYQRSGSSHFLRTIQKKIPPKRKPSPKAPAMVPAG